MKVTPEYAPIGDRDSWKKLQSPRARYDPCRPVPYAVNPRILPADGIAVLNEALFRVEKASGLRYRYSGATAAIPFRSTPGREQDRTANLVVAWSTAETDAADLAGSVIGSGGPLRSQWVEDRRTNRLTRTGVLLDAGETFAYRGFEDGSALGAVHMHLLGLALGLGQVDDRTQIMFPQSVPPTLACSATAT